MKALEFICCKAIKSRSLFSSFSFQVLARLTILGLHLAIQTWYRNYLHSTNWVWSLFHFLLYAAKGLSSLISSWEADDSESKFKPCKDKPNTHAWSTVESLSSNLWLFFPVHGSVPLSLTIQGLEIFHNYQNTLTLHCKVLAIKQKFTHHSHITLLLNS